MKALESTGPNTKDGDAIEVSVARTHVGRLRMMSPLLAKSVAVVCLLVASGAAGENGPVANTRKSIAQGKQFYLTNCVECHDQDGKGLGRRDFSGTPPADLTNPDEWRHGTSSQAIFSSIRDGTKEDMPPFKGRLQDDQIWHVVNFVRSLWPEEKRPKLEDEH